jgi:glycosyltransferase involved in cell wall biosynthesis
LLTALHVLNELRPSGMERMLESSASLWHKHGWRLILVGAGSQHTFAEELRIAGYEVILLPKIKSIKGLVQLAILIRGAKPDVIHNHSESCHGFISLLSRCVSPRTPIVRTIHNCFKFSGRARIQRFIQHYLENLSKVFRVSVGSDVQLNERENWNTSSTIVENWMDTSKIQEFRSYHHFDTKSKLLRICLVGNCSPIKDHAFALKIINEFDQIELLHIGENSGMDQEERNLIGLIQERGQLLHNGPTNKVLEFFKESDLHIISSTNEGAAVVVIESVVLGIETWVRDAPGLRWAFDLPGIRVFRTQAELRKLLSERLLIDENKKTTVEIRAKEMERFSPHRGVFEYTQIYNSLLM